MRQELLDLEKLGPLPSESGSNVEQILAYEELIGMITPPVSDDEVEILVNLFGTDECFGLSWSLVHLIETAPSWPMEHLLRDTNNEWIILLRKRVGKSHFDSKEKL